MSVMHSSAWPGENFYLPVKIEIAPGTKVYSGYFEINYNGNVQGIKESVETGDFNISVQNNAVTNLTRVSFASTNVYVRRPGPRDGHPRCPGAG